MIKLINIFLFFYILELSIYANNISTYLHTSQHISRDLHISPRISCSNICPFFSYFRIFFNGKMGKGYIGGRRVKFFIEYNNNL